MLNDKDLVEHGERAAVLVKALSAAQKGGSATCHDSCRLQSMYESSSSKHKDAATHEFALLTSKPSWFHVQIHQTRPFCNDLDTRVKTLQRVS
jgi:hypothetical protein